ncbi:hypothetical protein [Cellvibrio sp.]|uniref:hypothetical protein n=1 Tax=Cellvibrio sp. TaxID=1965322 RepID=UPI0039647495
MKTIHWLFLTGLLVASLSARAAVIPLSSFDGSETVVDFDNVSVGVFSGTYKNSGVIFSTESGSYIFQNTGWLLGTSGYAFNSFGLYPDAKNDIELSFGSAITRFGMNFGNGAGSQLSAVVSAYDGSGNLVESLSFTDFDNAFVGFDFSSAVSKIIIDRTDGTDYFTFLDDVRFAPSISVAVPESSSLVLALIGLIGLVGLRMRKSA